MADVAVFRNPLTGTIWRASGSNIQRLLDWGWVPVGEQPPPSYDPYPVYMTEAEGRAAFEPRAIPAHAGPRARRFDPARSIYNLTAGNIRRARAALGAARAGTGLCRIAMIGDSLTAGDQSTLGTNDPATMLRSYLAAAGFTADELPHPYHAGTVEPRVTTTFGALGLMSFPWFGSGTAGATYEITGAGTVFEVVFADNTDGFTISIDGGAAVAVTPSGVAAPASHTITGLSDGEHTAVITAGGSGTYIYTAGFRHTTGIVLENAGLYNATTSDWLDGAAGNFTPVLSACWSTPDVAFLELGVNDWKYGVPIGMFRDNLTSIVDQVRAHAGAVILAASNYPSGSDATWAPYVAAIYDVADAQDLPLVDLADSFGPFAVYNADGMSYDEAADTAHLSPAGYAHKARALANVLLA